MPYRATIQILTVVIKTLIYCLGSRGDYKSTVDLKVFDVNTINL